MGRFARRFAFPLGADPVVAVGVETVATIALDVESGARLKYEWLTDVLRAWSGKETRHSIMRMPRQRYRFDYLLSDEQQRDVMATLARHAPDGAAFLLGLAYEDLSIVGVAGTDVSVGSLAQCDWAVPGQRVVIVSRTGEIGDTFIASVVGSTMSLDAAPASLEVGGRIMPGVPVYLDAMQPLSRYAVNAGTWELSAFAALFRFGTSTALPGVGATLTTFESLVVWDVGIQTNNASQPMISGAELLDERIRAKQLFRWSEGGGARTLRIESSRQSASALWQWLKRFLHTVRGCWKPFLLPSGRVDLVHVGDASSGTLTIEGVDYEMKWFPSLAHRRLAIVLDDGTVAYRSVSSAVDNGDGTQDLTLSASLVGTIARVEFLELVRLDSDEVEIEWESASFACEMLACVVQQ